MGLTGETDGVRAILSALRRDRDEAQFTQLIAAVAGMDSKFAGDLARVVVAAAPKPANFTGLGEQPAELRCSAEEPVRRSRAACPSRLERLRVEVLRSF